MSNACVPSIQVAPHDPATRSTVRLGVPLPRGWIDSCEALTAVGVCAGATREAPLNWQGRVLARWPDLSIKWILVDLALDVAFAVNGGRVYLKREAPQTQAAMAVVTVDGILRVNTGVGFFEFKEGTERLVESVRDHSGLGFLADGLKLKLKGANGTDLRVTAKSIEVTETGPVRTVVLVQGHAVGDAPIEFAARCFISAGSLALSMEVRLRNPRAALHAGGLWDLGDRGSVHLSEASLLLQPADRSQQIAWCLEPGQPIIKSTANEWIIRQESSGGERWDSPNHIEADGSLGVAFRGYDMKVDGASVFQESPAWRAQPTLAAMGAEKGIATSLRDFWQNFPKSLAWSSETLQVGLFPDGRRCPIELQGGEQRRHFAAFAFGPNDSIIAEVQSVLKPPHVWVDPEWVESTGAVKGLITDLSNSPAWTEHVRTVVDGPNSFMERREIIDEYGWRHFGDLYADHEAVHHAGSEPFVSHYNNQYDFVFGATMHALRTGDARWSRLARECAEHTVDIDIYHTFDDRAAFNGGMFWHTDHYLPARTATHRTYSALNAGSLSGKVGSYGGGPSNEHNYASGLLLHHYSTGDQDALESVVGLAEWVIAMDDGEKTLFGLVDAGPTGLASCTLDNSYHGPGRGAGNSIMTLLDGYQATGRREFLSKAEELIQRCVHPSDDIAVLDLANIENRWSYLAFLQAVGKYLELKLEMRECDYHFQYARECLLHYADWMLTHEVPYKDVLHKVELPTETWPAHDMRKCHIFHLAARFDEGGRSAQFRERASFFHDRCLQDLSGFQTRGLTRPLVLLTVYGHLHSYFSLLEPIDDLDHRVFRHAYYFGRPALFVRQRDRIKSTIARRAQVSYREIKRLALDRLARFRLGAKRGRKP